MRRSYLFGMGCAVMLTACVAPDYQGPPAGAVAQVHFVNSHLIQICEGGTAFYLKRNGSGKVSVPAGRPVHLASRFQKNQGFCLTEVKFTPQAGRSYDIIVEARDEQCFPTVMAYDRSAPNGVRVEPSTSPAYGQCR